MVAPIIWIDREADILCCPPKGKKTVGEYISRWLPPKNDWTEYEITEYILNAGTQFEADQMLSFNTTEEDDTEEEKTDYEQSPRVESPMIYPKSLEEDYDSPQRRSPSISSGSFKHTKYDTFVNQEVVSEQSSKVYEQARNVSCRQSPRVKKNLEKFINTATATSSSNPKQRPQSFISTQRQSPRIAKKIEQRIKAATASSSNQEQRPSFTSTKRQSPRIAKKIEKRIKAATASSSNPEQRPSFTSTQRQSPRIAKKIEKRIKAATASSSTSERRPQKYPVRPNLGRGQGSSVSRFGDGGDSFNVMSTKRFQYTVLMELAEIKERQLQIIEMRQRNVDVQENDDDILVVSATIEDFDDEEKMLESKNHFKMKKMLVKQLGGKDVRSHVRRALDAMMTRGVQNRFSKTGTATKRAFNKTRHYNILTAAIGDSTKEGYDLATIDYIVSDLLKRAKRQLDGGQVNGAEDIAPDVYHYTFFVSCVIKLAFKYS